MRSQTSHNIKHRASPNDEFYTPPALIKQLLPRVPVVAGDYVMDPAFGTGNFYNEFATAYGPQCRYSSSTDFFNEKEPVDWLITNPPYSKIDEWLTYSCFMAKKGFAYLLLSHAITPKRLELCSAAGFSVTKLHMSKVFLWYGISQFVVWEKAQAPIITYDRTVWR